MNEHFSTWTVLDSAAKPWFYLATFGILAAFAVFMNLKERGSLKQAVRLLAEIKRDVRPRDLEEDGGQKFDPPEGGRYLATCKQLEKYASHNLADPLSVWVLAIRDASNLDSTIEPSALTDAFWSKEKERNRWPRFLAKNMVLVGLLFTSVGLARAVHGLNLSDTKDALATLTGTIGAMSTSFFTSILGLCLNLVLSSILVVGFEQSHDGYLKDADASFRASPSRPSRQRAVLLARSNPPSYSTSSPARPAISKMS